MRFMTQPCTAFCAYAVVQRITWHHSIQNADNTFAHDPLSCRDCTAALMACWQLLCLDLQVHEAET